MINKIRSYSVLLFCLLIVNSSCQRHEEESVYVSVPDKSITPVRHFKQHEIKMKCGRTVKFTLPAEFSDKYPEAGRRSHCGEDLVEQFNYGVKNEKDVYFSVSSCVTDLSNEDEKILDLEYKRWSSYTTVVPLIEKKVDKANHIFHFIYIFEPTKRFDADSNNLIYIQCYCETIHEDTGYGAQLCLYTNKYHFDFPTYRKIMESVQIR